MKNSSVTFKEFLSARKAEIKAQIAALKAEYRDIQAAESALSPESFSLQVADSDKTQKQRIRRSPSGVTIKQMVITVMADFPNGAEAQEISDAVKEKYGKDIKRESMSPQLSRLRHDDGVLDLRDGKWFLKQNENNAQITDWSKIL